MITKEKNFAYIDAANLHNGTKEAGWKINYRRFRIWLKEKYAVERAYLFIGLVPKYNNIYNSLQDAGFILVFKETVCDGDGNIKGNCDADLVLWAVRDSYEKHFDKAVIVSSDGDYASLIGFLLEKDQLKTVLSPSRKCSILIKRIGVKISYLDAQKNILAYNKKAPDRDGTL